MTPLSTRPGTENARYLGAPSAPGPLLLSYVVRFADRSFLRAYLANEGTVVTLRKKDAKQFYSLASAERTARLLRGTIEPFNEPETSSGTISEIAKLCYVTMCDLGNAKFRGVFPAFKKKDGSLTEALILFDSLKSKSTLALPISRMSAEAVRKHVQESNEQFEGLR